MSRVGSLVYSVLFECVTIHDKVWKMNFLLAASSIILVSRVSPSRWQNERIVYGLEMTSDIQNMFLLRKIDAFGVFTDTLRDKIIRRCSRDHTITWVPLGPWRPSYSLEPAVLL